MDCNKFLEYFNNNDGFSHHNGLRLVALSPGYCRAEFIVEKHNLNFMGTVHGGILFGAADIAAGSALAAHGKHCVTLNSSITYLRAASAGTLTAEAKELYRGNLSATYDISITDKDGVLISKVVTTMYITKRNIEFDESGAVLPIR